MSRQRSQVILSYGPRDIRRLEAAARQELPRMPPDAIADLFGLTFRQALFVAAYVGECRFNATRAALAAGYSPKYPRQSGSQAMSSPKVREATSKLSAFYLARKYGQT